MWMFGSRTTVKKVRNSLTWFSHGSGASLAPEPLGRFFLLHAAKVRSSCEEGPGQSALQSAYHNPKLDVSELKQNRTP